MLNVLLDKERDDAFKQKKESNSWLGLEDNDFEEHMNDHLNNSFLNVSEIFKYSNYLHVLIIGQGGIFGMGNTYEEDEEGEEENSIKSEDSTPFGLSSLVKTGTFSGVNSLSNYTSNLDE